MDAPDEGKALDHPLSSTVVSSDDSSSQAAFVAPSGYCQVLLATGETEATPVLIPTDALNMVLQAVTAPGESSVEAQPTQLLLQAKSSLQTPGGEEPVKPPPLEPDETVQRALRQKKLESEEVATTYIEIQQISEDTANSSVDKSSSHSPQEKSSSKKGSASVRLPSKKKVTKSPKTPQKKTDAKKADVKKAHAGPVASTLSSKSLTPGTVIPATSLLTGLLQKQSMKSDSVLSTKNVIAPATIKNSPTPKVVMNKQQLKSAYTIFPTPDTNRPSATLLSDSTSKLIPEQVSLPSEKQADTAADTLLPSQTLQTLLTTDSINVPGPSASRPLKVDSSEADASKQAAGAQPQILLLAEGGIANLAALQAGIIPLPLSVLQQAAANQGIQLTAGVQSQPIHVTLDPSQESGATSLDMNTGEKVVSSDIGLLQTSAIPSELSAIEGVLPAIQADAESKVAPPQSSPVLQTVTDIMPSPQDSPATAVPFLAGNLAQTEVSSLPQPTLTTPSMLLAAPSSSEPVTSLPQPVTPSKSTSRFKKLVPSSSFRGIEVKKPSVMRPILPKGGMAILQKAMTEKSAPLNLTDSVEDMISSASSLAEKPGSEFGTSGEAMNSSSQTTIREFTNLGVSVAQESIATATLVDSNHGLGQSELGAPQTALASSLPSDDQLSTPNIKSDSINSLNQQSDIFSSGTTAAQDSLLPVTEAKGDAEVMLADSEIFNPSTQDITEDEVMVEAEDKGTENIFMPSEEDDETTAMDGAVLDRVFSSMSVTLTKEVLEVIPKSKGAFLSNLAAEHHSNLVACPSKDMYTIRSKNFDDIKGIHQALYRLLEPRVEVSQKSDDSELQDSTADNAEQLESLSDPQINHSKMIRVTKKSRPRGRPRKSDKLESMVIKEDPADIADPKSDKEDPRMDEAGDESEASGPKLSQPRFSRSGRPLKLRKIDVSNLEEGDAPETISLGQTLRKRRKVGRPRKVFKSEGNEGEVLKENQRDPDYLQPDLPSTLDGLSKLAQKSLKVEEDTTGDAGSEDKGTDIEALSDQHSEKENVDDENNTPLGKVDTDPAEKPSAAPVYSSVAPVKSSTLGHIGHKYIKRKDYEASTPFKFFCSKCSFKTKRQSHYNRHVSLHKTSTALWHCDKCPFTALRLNHLRRHEQLHMEKLLNCKKCSYQSVRPELMAKHYRKKHQMTKGVGSLSQHSSGSFEHVYQCKNCDYRTFRKHLYIRHLNVHTIKSKEAAVKGNLPQEYVNKVVREYSCSKCPYTTQRKEHYVRHLANIHEERRPYLCDTCGKSFKRQDSLRSHAVVHQDKAKREFAKRCPICHKGLRSNAHLKEHLTTHSSHRAYLCEICGASFKTRSVQRKHVQSIHKNPHSHPCSKCPKTFNTKYSLLRHEKTHDTPGMRQVQEQVVAQVQQDQQDQQQPEQQDQQPQLLMPENQSGEIILPTLSTDEMTSIQIELPSGEVITQSIHMPQQIIQVADGNLTIAGESQADTLEIAPIEITPGESYEQSAGEIVQQINTQQPLLQTEATTALLYLNTATL